MSNKNWWVVGVQEICKPFLAETKEEARSIALKDTDIFEEDWYTDRDIEICYMLNCPSEWDEDKVTKECVCDICDHWVNPSKPHNCKLFYDGKSDVDFCCPVCSAGIFAESGHFICSNNPDHFHLFYEVQNLNEDEAHKLADLILKTSKVIINKVV